MNDSLERTVIYNPRYKQTFSAKFTMEKKNHSSDLQRHHCPIIFEDCGIQVKRELLEEEQRKEELQHDIPIDSGFNMELKDPRHIPQIEKGDEKSDLTQLDVQESNTKDLRMENGMEEKENEMHIPVLVENPFAILRFSKRKRRHPHTSNKMLKKASEQNSPIEIPVITEVLLIKPILADEQQQLTENNSECIRDEESTNIINRTQTEGALLKTVPDDSPEELLTNQCQEVDWERMHQRRFSKRWNDEISVRWLVKNPFVRTNAVKRKHRQKKWSMMKNEAPKLDCDIKIKWQHLTDNVHSMAQKNLRTDDLLCEPILNMILEPQKEHGKMESQQNIQNSTVSIIDVELEEQNKTEDATHMPLLDSYSLATESSEMVVVKGQTSIDKQGHAELNVTDESDKSQSSDGTVPLIIENPCSKRDRHLQWGNKVPKEVFDQNYDILLEAEPHVRPPTIELLINKEVYRREEKPDLIKNLCESKPNVEIPIAKQPQLISSTDGKERKIYVDTGSGRYTYDYNIEETPETPLDDCSLGAETQYITPEEPLSDEEQINADLDQMNADLDQMSELIENLQLEDLEFRAEESSNVDIRTSKITEENFYITEHQRNEDLADSQDKNAMLQAKSVDITRGNKEDTGINTELIVNENLKVGENQVEISMATKTCDGKITPINTEEKMIEQEMVSNERPPKDIEIVVESLASRQHIQIPKYCMYKSIIQTQNKCTMELSRSSEGVHSTEHNTMEKITSEDLKNANEHDEKLKKDIQINVESIVYNNLDYSVDSINKMLEPEHEKSTVTQTMLADGAANHNCRLDKAACIETDVASTINQHPHTTNDETQKEDSMAVSMSSKGVNSTEHNTMERKNSKDFKNSNNHNEKLQKYNQINAESIIPNNLDYSVDSTNKSLESELVKSKLAQTVLSDGNDTINVTEKCIQIYSEPTANANLKNNKCYKGEATGTELVTNDNLKNSKTNAESIIHKNLNISANSLNKAFETLQYNCSVLQKMPEDGDNVTMVTEKSLKINSESVINENTKSKYCRMDVTSSIQNGAASISNEYNVIETIASSDDECTTIQAKSKVLQNSIHHEEKSQEGIGINTKSIENECLTNNKETTNTQITEKSNTTRKYTNVGYNLFGTYTSSLNEYKTVLPKHRDEQCNKIIASEKTTEVYKKTKEQKDFKIKAESIGNVNLKNTNLLTVEMMNLSQYDCSLPRAKLSDGQSNDNYTENVMNAEAHENFKSAPKFNIDQKNENNTVNLTDNKNSKSVDCNVNGKFVSQLSEYSLAPSMMRNDDRSTLIAVDAVDREGLASANDQVGTEMSTTSNCNKFNYFRGRNSMRIFTETREQDCGIQIKRELLDECTDFMDLNSEDESQPITTTPINEKLHICQSNVQPGEYIAIKTETVDNAKLNIGTDNKIPTSIGNPLVEGDSSGVKKQTIHIKSSKSIAESETLALMDINSAASSKIDHFTVQESNSHDKKQRCEIDIDADIGDEIDGTRESITTVNETTKKLHYTSFNSSTRKNSTETFTMVHSFGTSLKTERHFTDENDFEYLNQRFPGTLNEIVNKFEQDLNHNTVQTNEGVIKSEPLDAFECTLSDLNISNPESTINVKQEYLELPNVEISDVKHDASFDIHSSQISRDSYADTEYSIDIKSHNIQPTLSPFTAMSLPQSQDNLLIPGPTLTVHDKSPKMAAVVKWNNTPTAMKRGPKKKSSTGIIKSRPTLDKGRKQNKKRKNKEDTFWTKSKPDTNLEKPKTRTKTRKQKLKEFPKPLKLEKSGKAIETEIATELPRPMMFKMEFSKFNTKNPQTYQIRSLQPLVKIKRINWSHAGLIPSGQKQKSGKLNVTRLTKHFQPSLKNSSTPSGAGQHILIQNAYSLNSSIPDASNSSLFRTHNTNQSHGTFAATSSPCDSGFSSSFDRRRPNTSILLEIAAQRAFINNHLTCFGYSPIQFELYNDCNDMSVFLKYLFGQMITRHK